MQEHNKKKLAILSFFNIVSLTTIVLLILAIYFGQSSLSKISEEVGALNKNLENADKRLESAEIKLISLQKEGYVEKPELASISLLIKPAIVFVLSGDAPLSDTSEYLESDNVLTVKEEASVRGTGFFITETGYIGTAKHVISGLPSDNIRIKDSEGKYHTARLVSLSEKSDVALLKVDGTGFNPVDLGYLENLQLGEEVGIMGFTPGFLTPLLTRGSISAGGLINDVPIFTINAFVNKGNSGSPVFSLKTGRVLGIISSRGRTPSLLKAPIDLSKLPPYPLKVSGLPDPIQLTAKLYNDTLAVVADAAQVGIGIVYPVDELRKLLSES